MDLGSLLTFFKLFEVGEGDSPNDFVGPRREFESGCYRVDGKLTQACWEKYIEPGGSYNDYQDYLNEK